MAHTCRHCNATFETKIKFCTSCGKPFEQPKVDTRAQSLNVIIVFYVIFLLYTVVTHLLFTEYPTSLGVEIIIESVFAALVIGFSILDYKSVLKLYQLPKVDWKILVFTFVFPVFTAFTVSIAVEYINDFLFEVENGNYLEDYLYLDYPLLWAFLFIAITPPIFEELAFRGFLFNRLQKVTSEKITIVATAFIFALVHFSFISLIWIFPFGLILGYIRSKYNTLWYGIIIHFIHNFIVLMIDYYSYNAALFEV